MRSVLPILAALCLSTAHAHEVRHRIENAQAAVVTLVYGNGKPFAHERYELSPRTADQPAQTGRSDSAGQVIFLPGDTREWRLKTFSAHGHGVDLEFDFPAAPPPTKTETLAAPIVAQPVAEPGPSRASLALFGFSALLAGFGIYQLFLRRRQG
ncbi:MAG: hypothetical protein Q8L56_11115 [Rhodocyclaceae bacterium]|nr:hypothetical protein [Rhodocyclaceae bacterium]